MKNAWWIVLACAAAMTLTGCGDDSDSDDGSSGSGAGTGAGSGSGSGAGSGAGTGSSGMSGGDDVFADYSCGGTAAANTCDQAICSLEMAYTSLQTSCMGAGAPAFCNTLAQCIRDLADCFGPACPSGSMATAAATTCVNDYLACFGGATGTGQN